jgi:hypothetical protein
VADLNGDATKTCVQFSSCLTAKCNTRAISTGAANQAPSRATTCPLNVMSLRGGCAATASGTPPAGNVKKVRTPTTQYPETVKSPFDPGTPD